MGAEDRSLSRSSKRKVWKHELVPPKSAAVGSVQSVRAVAIVKSVARLSSRIPNLVEYTHQLTSFGTNGFNLRDFRIEFLQKQKPILALGRLFCDNGDLSTELSVCTDRQLRDIALFNSDHGHSHKRRLSRPLGAASGSPKGRCTQSPEWRKRCTTVGVVTTVVAVCSITASHWPSFWRLERMANRMSGECRTPRFSSQPSKPFLPDPPSHPR